METTNTSKNRTITLTDRAPVKIKESEWPVIAQASGDSADNDYARHNQAEVDTYIMKVRRHYDGRALVYGIFDAASAWAGSEDHKGGVLLAAGDDIPAAIRRVGEECGLPDPVIRECIANLPAEEI
jgi:hypothetical protein